MERMTRRDLFRWLAGGATVAVVYGPARYFLTQQELLEAQRAAIEAGVDPALASDPAVIEEWRRGSLGGYRRRDYSPRSRPVTASTTTTTTPHVHDTTVTTTTRPQTNRATTTTTTTPTTTTTTDPHAGHDTTTTTTPSRTTETTAPPPPPPANVELSGRIGPLTIPAGTTARIVGNVELAGKLSVVGVLTGIDTFTLKGNGHEIEVHQGGRIDLRGKPKSGWIRGGSPSGWANGDRVVTAPIARGRTGRSGFSVGSWPVANPQTIRLLDGRTFAAEQFNLDRSIVFDGVSRIMFHHGAGVQVLKHLAVRNAGRRNEIGFYPIHFHLNGNASRGSVVEGVVVEKSANRAFVPHGSHGITFIDCVAYDVVDNAYWWDEPNNRNHTANNSNDTVWRHCLAAYVHPADDRGFRLAAFQLGAGRGNKCIDCTAVGVQGGKDSSGYTWPEAVNDNVGGNTWEFRDCVAHNNVANGIFTWQNDDGEHPIDHFVAYRNGGSGIDHGAYVNRYRYADLTLQENALHAVESHAVGRGIHVEWLRVNADGTLLIPRHSLEGSPVLYRNCSFAGVVVDQRMDSGSTPSQQIFEDCNVTPDSFDMRSTVNGTRITIREGGRDRWEWSGSWRSV